MKRPEPTEYAEFYAGYVSEVPGSDVLGVLESQRVQMLQLFAARSERDGSFRYAPGKWTVKEVLGHINDRRISFGMEDSANGLLRILRRNLGWCATRALRCFVLCGRTPGRGGASRARRK